MSHLHPPSFRLVRTVVFLAMLTCTHTACTQGEAANTPKTKRAPSKALVGVATIRAGSIDLRYTYLGEVMPHLEASLAAGASGVIEEVKVRQGTAVTKGQTLVSIDQSLVSAQIKQAQAAHAQLIEDRAQAMREADRVEQLGPEVTPQIQAERSRSRARSLKAAIISQEAVIKQVRATQERHLIVAPFHGIITTRTHNPGDWIAPGTSVLTLVDPTRVEVFIRVPAHMADDITIGHKVTLLGRRHQVEGSIIGIVPALEPTTRTLTLRITPEHKTPWLIPGDVTKVILTTTTKSKGIVVPEDAIVSSAVGSRVILVSDTDHAVPVHVDILARNDQEVLLKAHDKLTPGTRVVTHGNERLRPNQLLKINTQDPTPQKETPK